MDTHKECIGKLAETFGELCKVTEQLIDKCSEVEELKRKLDIATTALEYYANKMTNSGTAKKALERIT